MTVTIETDDYTVTADTPEEAVETIERLEDAGGHAADRAVQDNLDALSVNGNWYTGTSSTALTIRGDNQ